MTVRFRIEVVGLDTTEGHVEYRFDSDLTVLAGPTGVGKTTLLELIKFGFGTNATLALVAVTHVESVILDVRIGDERLRLTRSLDSAKRSTVRVTDLHTQERMADHYVGGDKQPSLNTLLLKALGLPDNLRAAAGGKSTREGSRITFADILRYLYIPQGQINHDIANSQDSYLEPKRKAVFEILFGLTDPETLALRSTLSRLKGEIDRADTQYNTVIDFLGDSDTSTRDAAQLAYERAEVSQAEAEGRLEALRETIDPVSDRETQALRDLLTDAEQRLAEIRSSNTDLSRRLQQHSVERRRVQADINRLNRMHEAGARLADIEFTVCPRCMQSLRHRSVPQDSCRLCLQDDPITSSSTYHDSYEVRQLTEQLTEMDEQLVVLGEQQNAVIDAIGNRENLLANLTKEIDQRTAERVTPRLQAFSDASQQLATARADQQRWEGILRQWDSVAELELTVNELRAQRANAERDLEQAQRQMQERRTEILEELSEEFESTVRAIGIPSVVTASIDSEKYLPVLNGQVFSKGNQLSGGTTTATQVAYWCSLLAVAMRHPETIYPAFLLIDSPQLALNAETALTAAMYRRLDMQVGVLPRRLQIIIADNELPEVYRGSNVQIDFDYSHPTVYTVTHPGRDNVNTIDAASQPGRDGE